jgi:hypothetical protein
MEWIHPIPFVVVPCLTFNRELRMIVPRSRRVKEGFGLLMSISIMASCGRPPAEEASFSKPLVTDVAHTIAKRQSIGNCWLYAAATWLESLSLSYAQRTLNVSESYWTWWHFYNQVIDNPNLTSLETGGSWGVARSIILKHGVVLEGDFIPGERNQEMSIRQKRAQERMDRELSTGILSNPADRTPENVRRVLDLAFGTDMAKAEAQALRPDDIKLGQASDGRPLSLKELLSSRSPYAWREIQFPRIFGENAVPSPRTELARKALWKRVLRALNDRQPVVVSLMIDFNGLDSSDGTFKGDRLISAGSGDQGGHLTVLEDYTVTNVPGIGRIGRGDVSAELKEKALEGEIETLVVKNSWGVNRPDRGIREGITAFDQQYLEGQFPWLRNPEDPASGALWYTTLSSFILPPGY